MADTDYFKRVKKPSAQKQRSKSEVNTQLTQILRENPDAFKQFVVNTNELNDRINGAEVEHLKRELDTSREYIADLEADNAALLGNREDVAHDYFNIPKPKFDNFSIPFTAF